MMVVLAMFVFVYGSYWVFLVCTASDYEVVGPHPEDVLQNEIQ